MQKLQTAGGIALTLVEYITFKENHPFNTVPIVNCSAMNTVIGYHFDDSMLHCGKSASDADASI